jgi:UDP-N-acetylmuramoyl-tripeptide--D-alanyl-D-alanine ligase
VVTMVQPVHLERMGSIERIALNKSELVRTLPPNGTAVLNGDDPLVRRMGGVTEAKVLYYGVADDGRWTMDDGCLDIYASDVVSLGLEGVWFTLHFGDKSVGLPVHLPLLGRHNVYTALAAAGVAHAVGMAPREIVEALVFKQAAHSLHSGQALSAANGFQRIKLLPGYNGSTLIDDCYNAAPASMLAALDLLSETPNTGRRIAVLGDMLELGSHEEQGHRDVGRRASEVTDFLIAVGRLGRIIGEEALQIGMSPGKVAFADGNSQAIDYLKSALRPGDYVLIKGSRGLHMEEIVEGLKG